MEFRRCMRSLLPGLLLVLHACMAFVGPSARGSDTIEVGNGATSLTGPLGRRDMAAFEGRALGEALMQLRPDWLRVNPSSRSADGTSRAVVYVNDVPAGGTGALQSIPSGVAVEVRLLSPSEARARYGLGCRCPAGAILVRTRTSE